MDGKLTLRRSRTPEIGLGGLRDLLGRTLPSIRRPAISNRLGRTQKFPPRDLSHQWSPQIKRCPWAHALAPAILCYLEWGIWRNAGGRISEDVLVVPQYPGFWTRIYHWGRNHFTDTVSANSKGFGSTANTPTTGVLMRRDDIG